MATVRLVAMVLPTVMFYFGAVYLSLDILRLFGFKAPFRISSTPKGSTMPTALYVMIEDVVAVDGAGGQIYRYALRTRYLSSPYFRRMLREMNFFWTGGALICAGGITAVVFTTPRPIAFTVRYPSRQPPQFGLICHGTYQEKRVKLTGTTAQLGWSLPIVWALIWTLITIPWVQSDLRREKQAWQENHPQGGVPFTDDVHATSARTRFESVQEHFPHLLPWLREKPSTLSDEHSAT